MNTTAVLTAMLPEHLLLLGIVLVSASRSSAAAARVAAGRLRLRRRRGRRSGAPLARRLRRSTVRRPVFGRSDETLLVKAMVLAFALPVLLMSRDEFSGAEFPALLLSSLYGVCLLQSADSFATVFLGLELMSLPVYVLVLLAWRQLRRARRPRSSTLCWAARRPRCSLMGASLLYGAGGSLAIDAFAGRRSPPATAWRARRSS